MATHGPRAMGVFWTRFMGWKGAGGWSALGGGGRKRTRLHKMIRDGRLVLVQGLHVAFEVDVEELEDEVELRVRVHDVVQPLVSAGKHGWRSRGWQAHAPDDVLALELLEQADLADGRAGHALILSFQPDLLERDDLVGARVASLVHDTVRAYNAPAHPLVSTPRKPSEAPATHPRLQEPGPPLSVCPAQHMAAIERSSRLRTDFLDLGVAAAMSALGACDDAATHRSMFN